MNKYECCPRLLYSVNLRKEDLSLFHNISHSAFLLWTEGAHEAGWGKKEKPFIHEEVTRESILHFHKCLHGLNSKKLSPQAIKDI